MLCDTMKFQVIGDANGTWQWRLLSEGGRSIARSVQSHLSEAQCLYEIALVMSSGNGAIERIAPDSPSPIGPACARSDTPSL